jgi:hypothetical protein
MNDSEKVIRGPWGPKYWTERGSPPWPMPKITNRLVDALRPDRTGRDVFAWDAGDGAPSTPLEWQDALECPQ